MKRLSCLLFAVVGLALFSTSALATPGVERPLAITISPFHLFLPMGEITAEYALTPKLGVAGILGFGQVSTEDAFGQESSFSVFEVGASGRYYLIGDFRHGLQVGLEALYMKISGSVEDAFGVGEGLSIGPFVGHKYTASFGLTLELQGGAGYTLVGAEASNDEGESATASDSQILPIVNSISAGPFSPLLPSETLAAKGRRRASCFN